MAVFKAEHPTRASDALAPQTSVEQGQRDKVIVPGTLLADPGARDALTVALAKVTAISSDRSVSNDSIDLDAINSRFHAGRCVCMACSAASRSAAGAFSSTLTGGTTSAATSAPVSLQILADYLTRDFWLEAGTYSRRFNLSSGGTGAKNGIITYNVTGWADDANGLSSDRQALTREVFKLYSATLGINFREVTGPGGDIRFTDNDNGAYSYTAAGWYTDRTRLSVIIDYSVVNVQASWYDGKSNFNTYTPQTIFHEIGHALGLGHQGQYNYTGTPATYEDSAQFANDSWQTTMMSYLDQQNNPTTGASFAWLQTPMAVDWIALNNLYETQGYSTASAFQGDTIYGFGTNITADQSQIWNLFSTYAGSTAYTIVDGSGYDTLDLSNFSADQLINLAPSQTSSTAPSISNIGGKIGNLTIASGTIIEAAIGGSGNDIFYGNNANNTFRGGAGNDSFFDSLGSDIYYGDAGIDTLYFSESIELLSYALFGDSLLFSRRSNSFDIDQVWSCVENIVFNTVSFSFADLVSSLAPPPPQPSYAQSAEASSVNEGSSSAFTLTTTDQILWGTTGSDTITGGNGNDQIAGVLASGTTAAAMGRGQIDVLTGGPGADVFVLGDSRGVFYDDHIGGNLGTADYARITDFIAGEDKLQLSNGTYLFTVSSDNLSLYWDRNGNAKLDTRGRNCDELIAILEGVSNLSGSDILFV